MSCNDFPLRLAQARQELNLLFQHYFRVDEAEGLRMTLAAIVILRQQELVGGLPLHLPLGSQDFYLGDQPLTPFIEQLAASCLDQYSRQAQTNPYAALEQLQACLLILIPRA